MYVDISDDKNKTTLAISSTSPNLFIGIYSFRLSANLIGVFSFIILVFVGPGEMELALILYLAISFAKTFLKVSIAYLLVAYYNLPALPSLAEVDDMLIIEPDEDFFNFFMIN